MYDDIPKRDHHGRNNYMKTPNVEEDWISWSFSQMKIRTNTAICLIAHDVEVRRGIKRSDNDMETKYLAQSKFKMR